MEINDAYMGDWNADCLRWRGKVLTGEYAHWCYDWDYLPVDETTEEWYGCHCFDAQRSYETKHTGLRLLLAVLTILILFLIWREL